jgi:flagellar FliL protein
MAKAPAKKNSDDQPAKPSAMLGIIGLLLATLIAGGAGAFFGLKVLSPNVGIAAGGEAAQAPAPKPPVVEKIRVWPLAPIITNLAAPREAWIRLETAIVVETDDIENMSTLTAKIAEDLVTYVRTLTLAQLEGPSALQHLKEDFNDRASLRSEGKVKEVVVYGMVAE